MSETPPNVDALLEDLGSSDILTRRGAIFALARTRESRAIERFKEIASSDESMELRYLARKALHLLSQSGKPDDTAKPPSSGETQIIAAEDIDTISVRLFSGDAATRASALRAAGLRKDPRLLPAVLMRADPGVEPHPEVRSLLPIVLAILGGADQIQQIAQFITDPDPRVKSNAIEALGRLNDVAGYAIIIRSLQDLDHRVISTAVKTLGRLGKVNVIQCCREMRHSPEYWVRDAAAFCLASAKYPEAIPLLATALEDEHEAVRIKAKNGLEKLAMDGHDEAREALSHAKDIKSRESPDDFLKLESSSSVWRPDFLTSEDVRLRRRAARQLAVRGARGKSLDNAIRQLKVEEDSAVLSQILVAIAKSKKPEAIPAIEALLTHESSQVRVSAVEALSAIGTDDAREKILPMLEDRSPEVVGKAIVGLHGQDGVDVEGPLERLMDDTDYAHKSMAIAVISELADPAFYRYLEMLTHDEDEEVASMARDTWAMLEGSTSEADALELSGTGAVKRFVTARIDARSEEEDLTETADEGDEPAPAEKPKKAEKSTRTGKSTTPSGRAVARRRIPESVQSVLTVLGTLLLSIGIGAGAGLVYRGQQTPVTSDPAVASKPPTRPPRPRPSPSPRPRATPSPRPASSPSAAPRPTPEASPKPTGSPTPATPDPAADETLERVIQETVSPAVAAAGAQTAKKEFAAANKTLITALEKARSSLGSVARTSFSDTAKPRAAAIDRALRTARDETLYDFERATFTRSILASIATSSASGEEPAGDGSP